ncbi:hypothetical protein HYT45_01010 [Candidatus Uhrbacteria bacterium]|nr:hypothetical protein [Candidatus Uhrbacteria bacterium]
MPVIYIFLAQLIYSLSDLGKKIILNKAGFGWGLLTNAAFLAITAVSVIGFALQMFALSRYDLSRTIILLGVFAVLISSVLGVLVLHERLSPINYLGLGFAVIAIVLVQLK